MALTRLGKDGFTSDAETITFSEPGRNIGDVNPSYSLDTPGDPNLGQVGVDFDGKFIGQTVDLNSLPDGNEFSDSDPSDPLTLEPNGPKTLITSDTSNPTSPVLSGEPQFAGTVSVKFDKAVNAVGLDGGFFDAVNSTTIEAYNASGEVLGSVTNNQTGIEFFGINSNENISGVSFFITGNEPAGYAVDNVTFGSTKVVKEPVPYEMEGATALLGVLAIFVGRQLFKCWQRRIQQA